MTIGARIAQARERAGKSQQDVAALFNIKAQAVSQWETGATRPSQDKLERLAEFFGVRLHWLLTGKGPIEAEQAQLPGVPGPIAPNVTPAPGAPAFPAIAMLPLDLPVYGTAVGGGEGDFQLNGERIDLVRRPPGLMGNRHAFAIYVQGDSMFPWKRPGALIFLDPNRPVRPNDYVVVECHGSDGEPGPAYLKMLVALTPTQVRLAQHNPPDDRIMLPRKRVKQIYRVLEPEEFMGA